MPGVGYICQKNLPLCDCFHPATKIRTTMEIILLALFYVLTPVLILYLTYRFRTADRLGSVIIAYLVGLILGNIGLIPSPGEVINSILLNQPGVSLSDLQVMEANGEITAEDVMAFRVYKLRDL